MVKNTGVAPAVASQAEGEADERRCQHAADKVETAGPLSDLRKVACDHCADSAGRLSGPVLMVEYTPRLLQREIGVSDTEKARSAACINLQMSLQAERQACPLGQRTHPFRRTGQDDIAGFQRKGMRHLGQ